MDGNPTTATTATDPQQAPAAPAAEPQAPAAPAAQPAPKPQAPAGKPTEPSFSREYVHELREEAKTNRIAATETAQKLEALAKEHEALKQAHETLQLTQAVTRAAQGIADPALLLDSQTFTQKIAGQNPTSEEQLTTLIQEWVNENPAYAAKTPLPTSSGNTPTGSSTGKPTNLADAINAHYQN